MDYKARVNFTIISGEEKSFSESANGSKLTKGEYVMNYDGGLEGKGEFVELKTYSIDGSVSIVGLERITGRLGEMSGSFVLEHHGTIKEGVITSHRHVIYGSGTEDLAGIRGEVKFEWDQYRPFFIFNYSLD